MGLCLEEAAGSGGDRRRGRRQQLAETRSYTYVPDTVCTVRNLGGPVFKAEVSMRRMCSWQTPSNTVQCSRRRTTLAVLSLIVCMIERTYSVPMAAHMHALAGYGADQGGSTTPGSQARHARTARPVVAVRARARPAPRAKAVWRGSRAVVGRLRRPAPPAATTFHPPRPCGGLRVRPCLLARPAGVGRGRRRPRGAWCRRHHGMSHPVRGGCHHCARSGRVPALVPPCRASRRRPRPAPCPPPPPPDAQRAAPAPAR